MKKILISGIAALGLLGISNTAVNAFDLAKHYKDQTVEILVGYGAGGTYGRTSLLLGRHLGRVIPGNPNLVVKHMPGAGGLKATNFFYNVAPKRGMHLLMPPEMTIVSALLRPKKVKFKTKELTWLGRVFGQNTTVVVRRDTGVTSLAGLKKKQVIMASSGKGSPTFLVPTMLNSLFGTKLKVVAGYKGSRKMQHTMEIGEAGGVALGWTAWISGKPSWFKGGDKSFAVPLVQSGFKPQKGIEHVPMIRSLLKNKEDKDVAAMLASAAILGRGLVLPPGINKALVKPLRAAFWTINQDKVFIADALKRGLQSNPIRGAEIQKIVNDLMNTPIATVKRARALIFPKKK